MNYIPACLLRKQVPVYVDDMNIIGTLDELRETADYLKSEFEMKDLGKTRFCLGLEFEYRDSGILIHQSAYTQKMIMCFNMDKVHPVSTLMIGRSLDPKKDLFRPRDDGEDVLEAEVPYLSAIGALLYLTQCTRPDISFSVNLLAKHSSAPMQRHWTDIKTIFRYLKGTIDMGLLFSYKELRKYGKMGMRLMLTITVEHVAAHASLPVEGR